MDVTGSVAWSDNTGCGTTTVVSTSGRGVGTATCTTSILGAGSDTVTATYSGDSNHNGGSGSVNQTVNPATATVTLSNTTQTYTGSALSPTVTTSSGLSYSLMGAPDTNAGSYPVTATIANSNYTGSASGTLVINQASQTINVTVPTPPTATYKSSFTVVASGGGSGSLIVFASGGACTNKGPAYKITATTVTCTIAMNQGGNANYRAAPQVLEYTNVAAALPPASSVSFVGGQSPAPYGSTFTVVATSTYNGSPTGITPTLKAAGACTLNGSTVTMSSGTGKCTVTADWAANDVYSASTATTSVTAAKVPSGLTWATPAPITYGTELGPTQLDATANVGGTFVN